VVAASPCATARQREYSLGALGLRVVRSNPLALAIVCIAAPVLANPPASRPFAAAIITPPANPERWQAYTPAVPAAPGGVIAPPATPDARPVPDGMVIAPPATRDTMGCAPSLFWEPRALWQHVERGATRLGSLLRAYGF